MTDTIESRLARFAEMGDAPELHWTEKGLVLSGFMLQTFHGDAATNSALSILYGDLCEDDEFIFYAPADWSHYAPGKLRQFPLYRHLRNLRAYGLFGLPVEACAGLEDVPFDLPVGTVPNDIERRWQCITALVERYSREIGGDHALPIAPELLFGQDFEAVVFAAAGRWKIDNGNKKHRVLPEEIAALANIIPKTVKNAMAPKSHDRLPTHGDGKTVPGDAAAEWLAERRGFWSSIWRTSDTADAPSREHSQDLLGEVLFIPVTKDGVEFGPLSKVNGRYRIGGISETEDLEDYRDALGKLQTMAVPKWQEEDPNGSRIEERAGHEWIRANTVELGLD